MKRIVVAVAFVLAAVCLSPGPLRAAEAAPERKAAEELLLLLRTDRNLDAMMAGVGKMFPSSTPEAGLSPEGAAAGRAAAEKMLALLKREMSWEKMKEKYIDIYASVFTEGEMRELSAFYRSPIGQKFVEKTPALLEKSMAVGRETMQRLLPEILKMTEEAVKEGKAPKGK
jgi:hypothetical protein